MNFMSLGQGAENLEAITNCCGLPQARKSSNATICSRVISTALAQASRWGCGDYLLESGPGFDSPTEIVGAPTEF